MRNFYSLLQRFHRSEAHDPKDQVYALLNMAIDSEQAGFPEVDYGKELKEIIDSVFAYLFPKTWSHRNGSHSYDSLGHFVKDFRLLREAEMDFKDSDPLREVKLSDDTGITHHHIQEGIQTRNVQYLQNLLSFPNINLKQQRHIVEGKESSSVTLFQPLYEATERGFTTIVEQLLATGEVEVDTKRWDGETPLSKAAMGGHETILKMLLASGKAEVNSENYVRMTPLSWAAQNGHESIVKLLLAIGKVNVDLESSIGKTPLFKASKNGHEAVVNLLLTAGKASIKPSPSRQSSLLVTAENGHKAVFKLLSNHMQKGIV